MVLPNLKFWSLSRKQSLDSQQKHALGNKILRSLLCSNDNLIPGYNRKMPIRKKTLLLTEFILPLNSCFLQYIAPVEKYVNVTHYKKWFSQECLVFCQLQINFKIFEVQIVSVTVYDNFEIICINLELYTFFSSATLYCPF